MIGIELILLYINFEEDEDHIIFSDKERIQQVLLNLLSNAFKFTEKGFIKICVEKLDETKQLKITVEDSGIGISKIN